MSAKVMERPKAPAPRIRMEEGGGGVEVGSGFGVMEGGFWSWSISRGKEGSGGSRRLGGWWSMSGRSRRQSVRFPLLLSPKGSRSIPDPQSIPK